MKNLAAFLIALALCALPGGGPGQWRPSARGRFRAQARPLAETELSLSLRRCEKLARQAKPPAPPSVANPRTASEVGQTVSSAGPPAIQFSTASDADARGYLRPGAWKYGGGSGTAAPSFRGDDAP